MLKFLPSVFCRYYMSICFLNKHILFCFCLCFYTRLFASILYNRLIYRLVDEKKCLSRSSSCSFVIGSVNCYMSLMMKMICYRFFYYFRHLHHNYSLLILSIHVYRRMLRHEMILFSSQLLLLLMS